MSLSPDGRTLAVAADVGIEIVDVASLRRRAILPGTETVQLLARFTPDGRFVIGESARVPGFVCAVGCNAHGVSGSAGIGSPGPMTPVGGFEKITGASGTTSLVVAS